MVTTIDPIWSDILSATAQQGDFEVYCEGSDIIADDYRLTGMKGGSSLRILGGKVVWPGHATAGYYPLVELEEDNIHLSMQAEIGAGHGLLAIDRSGLEIDLNIVGNQRENAAGIMAGNGPIAGSGYGANLRGLRNSSACISARGTLGGTYCFNYAGDRVAMKNELQLFNTDVAHGNCVISGVDMDLLIRNRCVEVFAETDDAPNDTILNGDGLTIGWAENLRIDMETMNNSCYGVGIGALSGVTAKPSRDIHFSRYIANGGVTAAFHAMDVEGLRIDEARVDGSVSSINLYRCQSVLGDVDLRNTNPMHIQDGALAIRNLQSDMANPIAAHGNPEIFL